MGKREDAKKTFKECLAIDPKNNHAISQLSFIYFITLVLL